MMMSLKMVLLIGALALIFCYVQTASVNLGNVGDHHHGDINTTLPNNGTDYNNSHHGNSSDHGSHESDHLLHGHGIHVISLHLEYVKQPLIIFVFILVAGIAKLGFHHADFLSSRVPESCLLIILGVVVGFFMSLAVAESDMPKMSAELFFLYLLPPIILESSYSLHDRTFFDNVGTVIFYAVVGTVLNCFLIGPTLYGLASLGAMGYIEIGFIPCLVLSAIIVAVDPVAVLAIFQEVGVNNVLYFLVFGESLFNDAVTVVLYNTMIEFNKMPLITIDQVLLGLANFFVVSLGGLIVGILMGILTAIITKYTEHVRVVEPLAVLVLAYIAYLVAELFHFSGIISMIGCGLTQAEYAFNNVSQKSHTTIKYFCKMLSSTSDCIIFLFLGIAVCRSSLLNPKHWHAGFILWTLVICLVVRFLVVLSLTYVVNKTSRMRRLAMEEQFIMAYGGLRGAVAFSLVNLLDEKLLPKTIFTTTTLVLIFFTVFVQGSTIKPLVKFLRVKLQEKTFMSISEEVNDHVTDHIMAGVEEILGERGEHYVREILDYYNRKYIKNWLQRENSSYDEHIMNLFERIALEQHFENLAGSKMIQEKYASNEGLVPITGICFQNDYEESDDESEDTILPSVTVVTPPTPEQPEGREYILQEEKCIINDHFLHVPEEVQKPRHTLFPILKPSLKSTEEKSKSLDNPTAKDVRKMLSPLRIDAAGKLDKNLKKESEVDLLKYLQQKQTRTRRMSRCVAMDSPFSSQHSISNVPRKSIDATVATQNYKRRLSLAVPGNRANFIRERSPSDASALRRLNQFSGEYRMGDASKSFDSPVEARRRRKMFRKSRTAASEDNNDRSERSPLILDVPGNSHSAPGTPLPRGSAAFDIIPEREEEEEFGIFKSHSVSEKRTRHKGILKKTGSVEANDMPHSPPHDKHTAFDMDVKHVEFRVKRKKKRPLSKTKSLEVDVVHQDDLSEALNNVTSHSCENVKMSIEDETKTSESSTKNCDTDDSKVADAREDASLDEAQDVKDEDDDVDDDNIKVLHDPYVSNENDERTDEDESTNL